MSTRIHARPSMSVEDFLRFDDGSPTRYEYVAGHVYAMAPPTMRHQLIVGNIYAALRAARNRGPCVPFSTDVAVRVGNDRVYLPDVTVICGEFRGTDNVTDNPCLVVEVLSESTRRIDETEKLEAYIELPSLRTYLIVEQELRHVERHWRDEHGTWHVDTFTSEQGARPIPIPCPETTLTLDEIYRDVPDVGDSRTPPLRLREVPV